MSLQEAGWEPVTAGAELEADLDSAVAIQDANIEAQLNDTAESAYPRPFVLRRDVDETGVSGTGNVAEGVEFSDGTVALRWTSDWPTSVVFHQRGVASVIAVHGHEGKTQLVWTTSPGLSTVDDSDSVSEIPDNDLPV